jgi:hypothetical protein
MATALDSKEGFRLGIEWWLTKKLLGATQLGNQSVIYLASQHIITSPSDVAHEKVEKLAKQLTDVIVEIDRKKLGSGS